MALQKDNAYTYVLNEILDKTIQLSEDPSQFAEYLSQQIREIIGARIIVIAINHENLNPEIYSVFPKRNIEWANQPSVLKFCEQSFLYDTIKFLDKDTGNKEISSFLTELNIEKTIAIPLIAQNVKVGSLLLFDILDDFGMEAVLDLLTRLSGIFALIIRNSVLYHNLEETVKLRTEQLKNQNEALIEREKELEYANNLQNENLTKIQEINTQLEEAKALAEESESQTRSILKTAMDGFWLVNLNGNIIDVNDVACTMLGYTYNEMIGLHVNDIEANETPEQTFMHISKIFELGQDRFETKHKCKNGNIIDAELTVKLHENKNILVVFCRDITARKQAEIAFNRSQVLYLATVEQSNDGITIVNSNGYYVMVNPSFCKMTGYTAEELLKLSIKDLISKNTTIVLFHQTLNEGKSGTREVEMVRKNGTTFFTSISASPLCIENEYFVQGIVRDITEIKLAEIELNKAHQKTIESEYRLKLATSSGKLGIWDWNVIDNSMIWDNRMFELYGLTADTFLNTIDAWINGLHPDDKEQALNECSDALSGIKDFDTEYRILQPNGKVLYIKADGLVLRDANGKALRMIGINKDISENIKAQEELIVSKARAEDSEELFKSMVKNVPGVVYQLRFKPDGSSYFTYISERATEMFNLSMDANSPEWDFEAQIPDKDKALFINSIAKAVTEKSPWLYEGEIITGNNEKKWFRGKSIPITIGDEIVFNGILEDITIQIEADKNLIIAKEKAEDNERKLKLFFDTLTEGVALNEMVFNENNVMVDYRIIEVNNAFYNIADFKNTSIIGNLATNIYGMSSESITEFWNNHKLNTETAYTEMQSPLNNKWFYIATSPFSDNKFVTSFFDISNLKLTEKLLTDNIEQLSLANEKIEENQKLYYDLVQSSHNLIWRCDLEGKFTFLNSAWESTLGYKTEEMLGKPFSDFQRPEVFARDIVEFARHLQGGFVKGYETSHIRKDGTEITLIFNALPLFNQKGEIIGTQGTAFDISKLKETEQELIRAKEKAEESDRLKTAFLQNMSHEIRTPMNAIMGFSALLVKNAHDTNKLKKFSDIINQRCNDLLDIISDILDIAKIESGQLPVNSEECNLSDLFDELKDFFTEYQSKIGKQNISFKMLTQCNSDNNVIITDKVKLKQIFINLIGNAFKFTNEGSIEGGCRFDNNNTLIFYVTDTGIGIPPDKHELVFERFAQLHQSPQQNIGGTGLGLSIVKGLVNLLGGEIHLNSQPNSGSTFTFTFPFKTVQTISKKEEINQVQETTIFNNKTILIVEDDHFNTEYLKESLADTDLSILQAEYGKKALAMAISQPLDLVLMDIRLPDISGYEVTRQILAQKPHIKIIAQTAYAAQDERLRAIEAGCIDYMSKPTSQETLFKLLRKHL